MRIEVGFVRSGLRIARAALLMVFGLMAAGCGLLPGGELRVPTEEEARAFFEDHGGLTDVEVSGNVVVLKVRQPIEQLRRGGSLWAKVGPYIYLFSPNTQNLLKAYDGVAAVRVVTVTAGGVEVARATLHRDTLSDILWRRSLNILGHALQEGTERPRRLEELVTWGERYTEYEYNPEFIPE
ncbi:MAG TPA: hypothetical protein VKZ58_03235 [Longimicrobiales bacterium]|nr:hypothetical protein [Longimicrobiales bacterium]